MISTREIAREIVCARARQQRMNRPPEEHHLLNHNLKNPRESLFLSAPPLSTTIERFRFFRGASWISLVAMLEDLASSQPFSFSLSSSHLARTSLAIDIISKRYGDEICLLSDDESCSWYLRRYEVTEWWIDESFSTIHRTNHNGLSGDHEVSRTYQPTISTMREPTLSLAHSLTNRTPALGIRHPSCTRQRPPHSAIERQCRMSTAETAPSPIPLSTPSTPTTTRSISASGCSAVSLHHHHHHATTAAATTSPHSSSISSPATVSASTSTIEHHHEHHHEPHPNHPIDSSPIPESSIWSELDSVTKVRGDRSNM